MYGQHPGDSDASIEGEIGIFSQSITFSLIIQYIAASNRKGAAIVWYFSLMLDRKFLKVTENIPLGMKIKI